MKLLALPQGARFTNKQIMAFLLPIFFEQLMVAGLNIADTFMVSFFGDVSVAGVALVSRIDTFAKSFFLALAQGGSVVMSQYIGAKDSKKAQLSMKNNIRIVTLIGILVMLVMVIFRPQILNLLYGKADKEILLVSNDYFMVTALSYPFVALYYANSSSFRAMGESKIPSMFSIIMMVTNLVLKYIFLFVLDMGIKGAALSTLVSMALTGIAMLVILHRKKITFRFQGFLNPILRRKAFFRYSEFLFPTELKTECFSWVRSLSQGLCQVLERLQLPLTSKHEHSAHLLTQWEHHLQRLC
ncbi:MAG: hypothetical protein E7406_09685 [Ruminococcaceae bacterium]|nr:hypothetical protein [Oscillospiraceae bacterium]